MLLRAVLPRGCSLAFIAGIDTTVSLDAYAFVEDNVNRHEKRGTLSL